MKISTPLPAPSESEAAHSEILTAKIIAEIQQSEEQSISFRRFMEMALYQPGLGYYVAGKNKLGQGGDFTTAPEVSRLYSQCIASQCQQVLEAVDDGCILEFGAGSGTMATEILRYLEQQNALPEHYYIIEVSPDLIALQKEKLQQEVPQLISYVSWLPALPENFTGIMLANEVLDAMPVDLFTLTNQGIVEQRISIEDNKLVSTHSTSDSLTSYINKLNITPNHLPYTSEINPHIKPWVQAVSDSLQQGIVLLIDYGYSRKEYYQSDRNMGTLLCYYQHRMHDNFLYYPGLQDITSNVDFTAVAEAGDDSSLAVLGFTPQATFLVGCGLEKHLTNALEQSPELQYPLAQQVRTLSLPAEMGERFKMIALGRGIQQELIGFSVADYRYKL